SGLHAARAHCAGSSVRHSWCRGRHTADARGALRKGGAIGARHEEAVATVTDRPVVPGFLLLEDGTLFRGTLRASLSATVAEVVFTTSMSGYQEVFTDPSYCGQIVVMTAPMIGNYGVNLADPESAAPQVAGVVMRELSKTYSNWRAEGDLESYLAASQIPILEGV